MEGNEESNVMACKLNVFSNDGQHMFRLSEGKEEVLPLNAIVSNIELHIAPNHEFKSNATKRKEKRDSKRKEMEDNNKCLEIARNQLNRKIYDDFQAMKEQLETRKLTLDDYVDIGRKMNEIFQTKVGDRPIEISYFEPNKFFAPSP